MTTGTKAQVVGKGLYLELTKDTWTDDYHQILIIPNLPDELGRKRDHTLVFSRNFYARSSRNTWSYPIITPITKGAPSLAEIAVAPRLEVEESSYYARFNPGMLDNKITIAGVEVASAEEHANAVLMELINVLSRDASKYSRESVEAGGVSYPEGLKRNWTFDKLSKSFSVEITDRDMLELYNDTYKVPSAIVNRIKQARMRIV